MTFGEKLKQARRAMGFTQQQLANLVGARNNSVSNWENDLNRPDTDTIQKICKALSVTAGYFFDEPQSDELEGIDFALFGEVRDLSAQDKQDVLDFIRFKKTLTDKRSHQ